MNVLSKAGSPYGLELLNARKNLKMSQNTLAEKVGMHQAELSRLEHGLGNPSLMTLEKIANALGLSIEIHFVDKRNALYGNTGIKQIVIDEIIKYAIKNDVSKVVLFGSRGRGDYKAKSDIDIAFSQGNKRQFMMDVDDNTSTLLMYDFVDLDGTLDERLRRNIKKDGVLIYEKV